MSMQSVVRHPVTWLAAIVLVSGTAYTIGRSSTPNLLGAGNQPILARQASLLTPNAELPTEGRSVTSLQELNDQFADLAEIISPSVVHIRGFNASGTRTQNPSSQGSGVIFRPDGWIVTNDHVVKGAEKVIVVLSNGREFEGKVTRFDDDRNDIAVVKIDAKDLPTARFADSSRVRPGQYAIAVGSPFGLENTVTIGHISAVGRMNAAGDGRGDVKAYTNMIQTDAPINPGNSGGPLLNIRGEIVGINTSIYSGASLMGGGQNAGIGFAIPSNQAKFIAELLMTDKKLERGYLNVQMATLKPFEVEELGIQGGVRVEAVVPGGAAEKAGLKAGDILTKIGSYSIIEDQDLLNAMLRYPGGETVEVNYLRDRKPRTVTAKVDSQLVGAPARTPQRRPQESESPFGENWLPELFGPNRETPERRPERTVPRENAEQARLGVQFQAIDADLRKTYSIPSEATGVVVIEIEAGSVASTLGIQPGDVITRLGSRPINSGEDLVNAVQSFRVGDQTRISFNRYTQNGMESQTRMIRF